MATLLAKRGVPGNGRKMVIWGGQADHAAAAQMAIWPGRLGPCGGCPDGHYEIMRRLLRGVLGQSPLPAKAFWPGPGQKWSKKGQKWSKVARSVNSDSSARSVAYEK